MESPFLNDPFAIVYKAFKNLYPEKQCEIWLWPAFDESVAHGDKLGVTNFPNDGSVPQVLIFSEHPANILIETLAHELAHVAVGIEHDHDDTWDAAFDAINVEYDRIFDELFEGKG